MPTESIREFYNSLHHIPSEEWDKITPLFKPKTYKKNDFFIQAQEIPLQFGIILSGAFRLYYIDDKGKEWVKSFRTDSQLVGTYAEILQQVPSRTFVQALTDAEILIINAHDFMKYTEDKLCWQILLRKIAEWHFIKKENREYEFLKLSAAERFENFKKEYATAYQIIPDYHIASYLGITPQALSRLQNKN